MDRPQLLVRPARKGNGFVLYLKIRGRLLELMRGQSYGECLAGARGVAGYVAAMALDDVILTEDL